MLSDEDIERGYKDVSGPLRGAPSTLAHGYLLSLSPRLGLATPRRSAGSRSVSRTGRRGVSRSDRHRPSALHEFELAFRFVLDPTARPGSYALPVHRHGLAALRRRRQNVNVTTIVSL